jgi:hypothetical protein
VGSRIDAFRSFFDAICMVQTGPTHVSLNLGDHAMLKHFRVPGRLATNLEELGVSVPNVLRVAGLPRDLFPHALTHHFGYRCGVVAS